jgi:hypothetical protein
MSVLDEGVGTGPGGGGGASVECEGGGLGDAVTISDVVLAFMHSWFQGNNQQEIVKLALSSFTTVQLSEATKMIIGKFPESGKFIAHRDTPGRTASEMFAADILKVFQHLDSSGQVVIFLCNSIAMRSVKVSTMLFSEEEPIIAHKMALMEKTVSDLLEGQKTLFSLIAEKFTPEASVAATAACTPTPTAPSSASPATSFVQPKGASNSYAQTTARSATSNTVIQRNQYGQSRPKRINSILEDEAFEESGDDNWEISAEEKRREKLRKRFEEKKVQEEAERRRLQEKKKPKFILGTGSRLDNKDSDCPGQAAPKHVFLARTAMSTTKETVEGCLEYLAGIKGVAVFCTPEERIKSGEAFSLSWRVQVDNADYEKALLPTSWKSGWAVKPYYFRRKKPEHLQPGQGGPLAQLFAHHAGQAPNLRHGSRP